MPLPTVDEAYNDLQGAAKGYTGAVNIGIPMRTGVLQAAVQAEGARTVQEASEALRRSVDAFTAASNAGTAQLAKWSQQTADATRGLKWATWALFVAMLVQIAVMVYRR